MTTEYNINNIFSTEAKVDSNFLNLAINAQEASFDKSGRRHYGTFANNGQVFSVVSRMPKKALEELENSQGNIICNSQDASKGDVVINKPFFNSINNGIPNPNKSKVLSIDNAKQLAQVRQIDNSIANTNLGALQGIDTMTAISSRVLRQRYYQVDPALYFSIETGEGAFASNIMKNVLFGFSDYTPDVNFQSMTGVAKKIPSVEIGVGKIQIELVYFLKKIDYNRIEINQLSAGRVAFSGIDEKSRELVRSADLSFQQLVLGYGLKNSNSKILGLGNLDETPNANVLIDTTTISKNISAMNADEIDALVSNMLGVASQNSDDTSIPNTLVMPLKDWLGLGGSASSQFPIGSKIELLQSRLSAMIQSRTGNPNAQFKILPSAYFDKSRSTETTPVSTYALYNNDPEVLSVIQPVPLTLTGFNTWNNFNFESVGYMQTSGLNLYRDREFMYFKHSN